jgi:hypothetical protein
MIKTGINIFVFTVKSCKSIMFSKIGALEEEMMTIASDIRPGDDPVEVSEKLVGRQRTKEPHHRRAEGRRQPKRNYRGHFTNVHLWGHAGLLGRFNFSGGGV